MIHYRFCRNAAVLAAVAAASFSSAARVYITSSGYQPQDDAVVASMQALGHTTTVGVPFYQFDGTQSLANVDVFYLQTNWNWGFGDMPAAGQQQIVNFVNAGGGLVTSEWLLWLRSVGRFIDLSVLFSSTPTSGYNGYPAHDFAQVTANPTINAGLPASFQVAGDSFAGTETNVQSAEPGGVVFYSSTAAGPFIGLTGRDYGLGRVAQFSQTVGENFLNDPNGFKLVGNVVEWVSQGAGTVQVQPDSFTLRLGRIDAGNLASLQNIDGNVMRICRFLVPNALSSPVTVEVEGTSPTLTPTLIRFRTYGRMANTGAFGETLDLYDWSLGAFSTTAVNTSAIGTNNRIVVVSGDAPVGRFVNAQGKVRGRFRVRQTGPTSTAAWCFEADQAVFIVG